MTRPLQRINLGIMAAIVAASTLSSLVTTTRVNAAVDCTNDAVVRCGITYTTDRQGAQDFRRSVERDSGMYGLSSEARMYLQEHGGTVNIARGQLTRDGYIVVGGEVVARESRTYGRLDRDTRQRFTYNNQTYYQAPAAEFVDVQTSEIVYVLLTSNGEYIAASMKGCGNPISARPVEIPTPPAPQPETPETPEPTPEPETPAPETPAPAPEAPVAHVQTPVVTQPAPEPAVKGAQMPEVLASTGATSVIAQSVGLGSITALLAYAVAGRGRLW